MTFIRSHPVWTLLIVLGTLLLLGLFGYGFGQEVPGTRQDFLETP